jgi:hypothetical protein
LVKEAVVLVLLSSAVPHFFGVVKLRRVVLGALTVFACVLFGVSIFLPFLSIWWAGRMCMPMGANVKFWSFKGAYWVFSWRLGVRFSEHSFGDYWQGLGYVGSGMGVLRLLLYTQVLTVLFAVLSILIRRFIFAGLFWATIFSLGAVVGMGVFSEEMKGPYASWVSRFDAGFGLTLASAMLFLAIFVIYLSWIRKKPA